MLGVSGDNPLSNFINSISSYDTNIMLAALTSLLVVILFVLLLHIYAKCFFTRPPSFTRRSISSLSVSHNVLIGPSTLHYSSSSSSSPPTKGLHPSIIASIPLFVYREEEHPQRLECVICLNIFEENEVGRSFTKCGHGFHVECIDMWLSSHISCPICRAPAIADDNIKLMDSLEDSRVEIVIDVPNTSDHEIRVEHNSVVFNCDSLSSSSSSSSSLGCSLKRMLSKSRSENKVFPSTINNT